MALSGHAGARFSAVQIHSFWGQLSRYKICILDNSIYILYIYIHAHTRYPEKPKTIDYIYVHIYTSKCWIHIADRFCENPKWCRNDPKCRNSAHWSPKLLTNTCVHKYIHTYMHKYMHMDPCMHTYGDTNMYIYINTYIYIFIIYIYIYSLYIYIHYIYIFIIYICSLYIYMFIIYICSLYIYMCTAYEHLCLLMYTHIYIFVYIHIYMNIDTDRNLSIYLSTYNALSPRIFLYMRIPAVGCAACGATDGVEVTDAPWQVLARIWSW